MKEEEVHLYLVLRQHLCRVNLTKLLEEKEPPRIETLLDFPDRGLPVGMGAFSLDSKFFLVGGEILKKGNRLDPHHSMSDSYIFESLTDGIFMYNHDDQAHRSELKKITSTLAPKPSPQIAILDGKLYVFAGAPNCSMPPAPEPRFESYDPIEDSWEHLPNPPFYTSKDNTACVYVSVIGRRIFVTNPIGVSIYDVDNRIWTGTRRIEGTPFEFFGRVVVESDDGRVVGYTTQGVVAYPDGTLTHAQVLKDVNALLPPPCMSQAAFFIYLGEDTFCLFLSELFGRATGGDWEMRIVLFRIEEEEAHTVKPEGGAEANFCRVTILRHHLYNASKDITEEDFNPTHAFTMGSSVDRGNRGGRLAEKVKELCRLSKGGEILPPAGRPGRTLGISAKRNSKKKEKRLRKLRGRNSESAEDVVEESVAYGINRLSISPNPLVVTGAPTPQGNYQPVNKRIQALKKKIRVLKKKFGLNDEQMDIWEELYRELILLQLQKARNC